jgi:protein phosphatase
LLGTDVEPDVSIREAREGDRYLLCTDGLTDVVSTDTLHETLQIPDPQEAADRLVELALRGGGPDNVTVIVADVLQAGPGDFADDVPVIAGAFVDPAAADAPGETSPAERAARIGRPAAEASADGAAPVGRRRRWRGPVIVLAVLVVIIGGLAGAYAVTQSNYFVGRDGREVAIFRGVNTEFGPIKFFNLYKNTDVRLNDLNPSTRSQVSDGINASNEKDAEQIVANLQNQLLPICPVTPTVTPTPSNSHSTSAPASSTGSSKTTRSSSPSPAPTPTPTHTPVPAVDCRDGS